MKIGLRALAAAFVLWMGFRALPAAATQSLRCTLQADGYDDIHLIIYADNDLQVVHIYYRGIGAAPLNDGTERGDHGEVLFTVPSPPDFRNAHFTYWPDEHRLEAEVNENDTIAHMSGTCTPIKD